MKDLTLEFPSGFVKSDTPDSGSLLLQSSSFTLRFLPVQIGELSESMALAGKRRMHYAEDNTEATMELENTIPFGAEPQIKRKFRISDGLAAMTMDLAMRASCTLTSVSAGGFSLGGVLRRVRLKTLDMKSKTISPFTVVDPTLLAEGAILYEGEFPPLCLSVETQTQKVDFTVGDDLWRWVQAPKMDGKSSFVIKKEKDTLTCSWQLYTRNPPRKADEEVEPVPGKNWRITWAVAWKDLPEESGKVFEIPEGAKVFSLDQEQWSRQTLSGDGKRPCFCSNGTINVLKKFVRSTLEDLTEGERIYLKGWEGTPCFNAGHMDRARQKELLHWDMMSLLDFVRWSNKILAKKGASLQVVAPEGSDLKDFMIVQ